MLMKFTCLLNVSVANVCAKNWHRLLSMIWICMNAWLDSTKTWNQFSSSITNNSQPRIQCSLFFIFSFVSSMILILFQYLTPLLFSHFPNHSPNHSLHSSIQSPFTLPFSLSSLSFSSNRSHFCLVTLFSSDPTIDLPSFFRSFSNSPSYFHSLLLRSLALFQLLSYFLSILTLSFSLLLSIALLPFNHIFSLALLPLSITHSFAHLRSL